MGAKSVFKNVEDTDHSTTNGVERELHPILDHCSTMECIGNTTMGALSVSCSPKNVKVAAVTEDNKLDVTKEPEV